MSDTVSPALAFAVCAVVLLVGATAGLGLTTTTPESGAVDDGDSGAGPVSADASLDALHAAGITGSNVTVGAVDVTGFDRDEPVLAGRLGGARAFGPDATVTADGETHGTAATRTVAAVAPGADLYLASFDESDDFTSAVRWLVARDVDVTVVVPPADAATTPAIGLVAARTATTAARTRRPRRRTRLT